MNFRIWDCYDAKVKEACDDLSIDTIDFYRGKVFTFMYTPEGFRIIKDKYDIDDELKAIWVWEDEQLDFDDIKDNLALKIKYHVEGLKKVEKIEQGDWVDLRSAYDYELKAGDFKLINLGITVKVPKGYEMNIVPRSSTFKKWGILQTNHFGIVDESYCGESDFIMMPVYATRDITIKKNDRICQFRLNQKMPQLRIIEVNKMEDESRGGFGSTGTN